jgi:hypothetical protein
MNARSLTIVNESSAFVRVTDNIDRTIVRVPPASARTVAIEAVPQYTAYTESVGSGRISLSFSDVTDREEAFSQTPASYYDRQATTFGIFLHQLQTPHPTTVWGDYTVPPVRRAFIESVYLAITRTVRAVPPFGAAEIYLRFITTGTSHSRMFSTRLEQQHIVAGTSFSTTVTGPITLYPGDTIEVYTSDLNAGGEALYHADIRLIEFDA